MSLELGGKAANIVFDDAPLDQAVEGIVNGIFFNQGHVCCAGSRLLVQESVAEEVVTKLQARMASLRLGDPLDKNTDIGAINSAAQLARIRELSDAGEAEGAQRWSPPCELPERGFWFPPTIFTGVSASHRIAREEIFGPVLSVLTFRTPQEAVDKANNTPYGLSAGIWTEKGSRILWMARGLRAGVVWANTFNRFDPASPFGGYKESGFGREGGRHGLEAYLASPLSTTRATARLRVRKTYKLAIGGAFPRSESGRSYPVTDGSGALLANAAQASRKDVRDAVVAARKALAGWSAATPYNRGAGDLPHRGDARGPSRAVHRGGRGRRGIVSAEAARRTVDESIDRIVWYAGWADKFAQVAGSANPIAGPYFNFSLPEPTGVVAVLAPQDSSLLGFVSTLAPVLCTGNTAVIVASQRRPLPAVVAGRGARHLGRPGRRRQRADRSHDRARALAREPPRRQRDRPHGRRRRGARRAAARGCRQRQARLHPGGRGLGAASPASSGSRPSSRRRPSGTRSGSEAQTAGALSSARRRRLRRTTR